jgi:hypothetical protein
VRIPRMIRGELYGDLVAIAIAAVFAACVWHAGCAIKDDGRPDAPPAAAPCPCPRPLPACGDPRCAGPGEATP